MYFLGIVLGDASTTVLRKKAADDGNLKGLMGRPLKKNKKNNSNCLINSAVFCAITDTTKPVEHFNILSLLCVIYNILFPSCEIQTTEGLIPSLV